MPAAAPDPLPDPLRRVVQENGMAGPNGTVDQLLARIAAGDATARSELVALLYDDLRQRAHALMKSQRAGHTLQATALANEACMRLLGEGKPWNDRAHFLAAAANAMRCVLVDHARARGREKRSPAGRQVSLDGLLEAYAREGIDVPALDEALAKLAGFDPLMAQAVELRYFAALDVDETARVLGLSKRTFERHFAAAMAWLKGALG